MAALTKDRSTPARDLEHVSHPMKGGVKIFAGALVVLDANGWAKPGATATGLKSVGRAERQVDNAAGADGDAFVLVNRKKAFRFDNLATDLVDRTMIGNDCFIVDDATVAATNGGNPATRSVAGKVVDVDENGVWVKFA